MSENTQRTISVPAAGAILGISRLSAYRAATKGQIPTIRLGRLIRVPVQAFDELLRNPQGRKEEENA